MNNFFDFTEEEDRIIFTNGCFDMLHYGHVRFLQACKELGGKLVVGINSDTSVKNLKGEHRPIISEYERKHMLLALDCVDEVIVFVEENPLEAILMMQPEIYVKSSEYRNANLPEFEAVKKYGGKVMIITPDDRMKQFSTTKIIDKIVKTELERRMK